jgi:LEA14-like dessication related protein
MKLAFSPFIVLMAVLIGGCAMFPPAEPVDVTVAGIEALPSEGLELRMAIKLRVQNPNDQAIDFDGVSVRLIVQDKTFATGVSDQRGTIPRFGTEVITVAVTVSPLRVAWNTVGLLMNDNTPDKIRYDLDGKIHRVGFGAIPFRADGEFKMPVPSGTGSERR